VGRIGFIYILTNPSLKKDLLKIGKATRTPEERASELAATGVPGDFRVVYKQAVADCDLVERMIHQELASYRYRENREFFELPIDEAISTLQGIITTLCSEVRAQLEMSWAVFFQKLETAYQFVRPSFQNKVSGFVPSFWLPEQSCWVGISSIGLATEDKAPIFAFAKEKQQLVFLFSECRPFGWEEGWPVGTGQYFTPDGHSDGVMTFGICPQCGSKQIGHLGSHDVTYADDGYDTRRGCSYQGHSFTESELLKKAYSAARKAFPRPQGV
jgi:hypothetical protein